MKYQLSSIWACCSAADPSHQGPQPWHTTKGQGGETLSDVTLLEEQTPFSYDVDYVLGDTVFSDSLEAALEHVMGQRPKLTPHRLTADGLPAASPGEVTWTQKKGFGLSQSLDNKSRASVTSQPRAVDISVVIIFWVSIWQTIEAVGSITASCHINKLPSG